MSRARDGCSSMYSTESRLRTFARSMTWRVSGVALAVALTWYFTGNPALGVELGLAYNLVRLSTHYFHDRGWARVRWGMRHTAEPDEHGMHSQETKLRTFLRSVTWRISGVALTVLLAIGLTGDLTLGLELGVSYNAIRLSTHYFHDRAWARWGWGMLHHEGDPPEPPERKGFWARFFKADPGEPEVAGATDAAAPAPAEPAEPQA